MKRIQPKLDLAGIDVIILKFFKNTADVTASADKKRSPSKGFSPTCAPGISDVSQPDTLCGHTIRN